MNWKAFITICVSSFFVSFPQNIIGCGPDADPYDYFTSFFHPNLPEQSGYQPFYYTNYNFLYDYNEPLNIQDVLAEEWSDYTNKKVSSNDALEFVNKYSLNDLTSLYFHIEKKKALIISDSVKKNTMTTYFLKSKDLEGLGYLMFAKKVQPFVIDGPDYWTSPERDSVAMAKLIKNGQQLYAASKKNIIKLKYGYQVLRLAHYSGQYKEAISIYDNYISKNTEQSILQPLSLALKAGAYYHLGDKTQAAYLFSKAFAMSSAKRISNFLSFNWSVSFENGEEKDKILQLCKNNVEKANMLALFALNNSTKDLQALQDIYSLDPANNVLQVLAVREVNKIEDNYLSGQLHKDARRTTYDYYWYNTDETQTTEYKNEIMPLIKLLNKIAEEDKSKSADFYHVAAAHLAYIGKDFTTAEKYLALAKPMLSNDKIKDQWQLTKLLTTISKQNKIDAAFEKELLPSVQWMENKAKTENSFVNSDDYYKPMIWKKFYRDIFAEIIAPIYRKQGDNYKEAFAMGKAESITTTNYNSEWSSGVDFLRDYMNSKDVEKMYALLQNKNRSAFEDYLVENTIKIQNIVDFAGTAYLRDYNFDQAIAWFKKEDQKNQTVIDTDPFIELLYDREERFASEEKFSITKLAFAEEMKRLQQLSQSDKKNAAKHLYKMALGMYNMTYYGHTWKLVQYYRSGSDGYYIPENASSFQKEYYGCFTAHAYFEKAMNASKDKNFKAKCLFMMGKCSQKQIHAPQWEEYSNNWDKLDTARQVYYETFMNNRYFPQLVKEYRNTAFYSEAFNSCSYLRDFLSNK
ncbi:MAG: hypothetical protein V4556_06740 [Bacteroidota bacterium]